VVAVALPTAPAGAGGARSGPYQYVSPVPGSRNVSPLNHIVLRDGRDLDAASLSGSAVSVTGSRSGSHAGRLVLSDDGRTLVFLPHEPFAPGERVAVTLGAAARARDGGALPPFAFEFSVAAANPAPYRPAAGDEEFGTPAEPAAPTGEAVETPAAAQGDLPASYPPVTLRVKNDPEPGFVFCTPAKNTAPANNTHLLILDNDAMPIFYRKTPSRPADFKRIDDGRLVYCEIGKRMHYALDSAYAVVDSFMAGNGYVLDSHDIVVLPNNHALLMIYDQQPVDMSAVVPGGRQDAIVTGLVLQEIDAAKNVVWQWRSWDHFEITDRSSACGSLTDSLVDYVHGNAIEVDHDGNLLLCSRYLNEITKIDRQTGDVIWRFGRNANRNQFTILNDPLGFSDQHDARRLPNGHITVFDNHYCISPKKARALEYELDEQNLTATLVSEQRHTPDQESLSGGGFRRHASGGGIVSWGQTFPPHITEFHADGTVAWEVDLWPATTRSVSYRAFRYPWRGKVFTTDLDSLDFGLVAVGDSAVLPLAVTNHTAAAVTLTSFVTLDSSFSVADAVPLVVPAGGSVTVQAKFRPTRGGEIPSTLYVRSGTATQLVAHPVSVRGQGDTSTPARLALFEAEWTAAGVEIRWQLGAGDAGRAAVERAGSTAGPWVAVGGDVRDEDGTSVLLDREALPGGPWYYRLVVIAPDGARWVCEPLALAAAGAPAGFALLGAAPSPGRGPTRIDFAVGREARVRVTVLDAQGRVAGVLADGVHRPGRHQVVWNGNRSGASAAAGLYFVRYEWPGGAAVRRIVRFR
jgi:hypothetical protein